ncbi:hypothetical protein, partial [Vibrio harveyi]|uniref:hypothetical protein n=1 Tax=Vibrio harveyi TaxID=669 RepID=UPI001E321AE7
MYSMPSYIIDSNHNHNNPKRSINIHTFALSPLYIIDIIEPTVLAKSTHKLAKATLRKKTNKAAPIIYSTTVKPFCL